MFKNVYIFQKNYVLGFEIKIIGFHLKIESRLRCLNVSTNNEKNIGIKNNFLENQRSKHKLHILSHIIYHTYK
jgi:hypothetical protein